MTSRGGPMGQPGDEVARWQRSDVGVSYDIAGYLLKVSVVAHGEVYECTVVKHDLTESFLRLLSDAEACAQQPDRARLRHGIRLTRLPRAAAARRRPVARAARPVRRRRLPGAVGRADAAHGHRATGASRSTAQVDEPLTLDAGTS